MSTVFRPRSHLVLAGVSFVLIVLFAANGFYTVTKPLQRALELALCIGLGGFTYAIWIRPKLVLGKDLIQVINPFRTERIAYEDVLDLETKWALVIVHRGGKTRVWVAPTSGKRRWIANTTFGWYGRGLPMATETDRGTESISESVHSLSGQAAYMIRERLKRLH
jgi:hypothetical protein